jgi:hypothetical protein
MARDGALPSGTMRQQIPLVPICKPRSGIRTFRLWGPKKEAEPVSV